MAKPTPRTKARRAAPRHSSKAKTVPPSVPPLVSFLYHDVDYQIDVEKSKVYRRFIEIEKSKQYSIMSAYRTGARLSA